MSQRMYNKLWTDAQEELDSLLEQELHVQTLHPEKDRVVFFQRLATLYVRYIQILRWLEEAYDQLVHPQKRRLVREVLDGVMGRIVELKNEMVEVEFSEYHYMNDVLQDLKLTPEDIKIPIPRYFISERSKELQERNMMLTDVLDRMEVTEKPRPAAARELLPEEAASIIQVAERARQGRLRANLMKEIRRDSNRQRRAKNQDPSSADIEAAAVDIQRVWRGYMQRKRVVQARDEELVFLGMAMEPRLKQQPCPAVIAAQANEARQRIKQEENESDYQRATVSITKQLRDLEAPEIRDSMKDQIQQWFIECRDNTGSFPDYPSEEDGGSALIFMEKTPQQLMEEITRKEEEEANKKLKEKEEKEKKNKGKAGEEQEEEVGLNMRPSAFLSDLVAARKTFVDIWQNRSESRNFSQRHESELIKEEKRKEIEAEVRLQVDELMRQELANLKLTADRDKGGKAKVNIKKKKGSKNAEKKKDKDLTADRSLESLHQELVEEGLLRKADNVKMQDYLGDYSYLATTLRQNDIEPMPSLCDVRQVLTLYAILPLGSRVVHKKAPLIKAILLVGPAGIGKKMLVHAICQETGATLFDLSPVNTAGKYPGKSGLAMMLHMVFKVARLMQPSVIWIGDTEKMFYKKVPKEEKELDPQRLKRDLTKMLEMIKGEERVLIVGTTKDPLNADMKSLCDVYKKIILIPRPDYGSRYVIWKQLIRKNGGEVTSALDLSSLAKISDGYTQGHMVQVIGGVLTERRISQQAVRPLTAAEFAPLLAKIDPVLLYEEEALKNWYAKTPLGKKRVKAATGKEEEEAPVKGKGAKKKGKK